MVWAAGKAGGITMAHITAYGSLAVSKIVIQTAMEVDQIMQLHIGVDRGGEMISFDTKLEPAGNVRVRCRVADLKERIEALARWAFIDGDNLTGTPCGFVEITAQASGLDIQATYLDRC